jgi:hypothetical protein
MRNLSTALTEEEIINLIHTEWVEGVRDKLAPSTEWMKATLAQFIQQGLIETLEAIKSAEAGDIVADRALRQAFAEMLDRGEMPPAALRAYGEKAVLQEPVKRGRGAHTEHDNLRRDIGIAVLVFRTVQVFGLYPTRNRESRRRRKPSASSVISEALVRAGISNVGESRVAEIYCGLAGQIVAFAIRRGELRSIPPK